MEQKETKKKIYTGEVVSDKMDKTLVVKTMRTYMHPLFHKIVKKSKKYKVHDPENCAKIGDVIEFYEVRPLSKTKYMHIDQVVKSNDKVLR